MGRTWLRSAGEDWEWRARECGEPWVRLGEPWETMGQKKALKGRRHYVRDNGVVFSGLVEWDVAPRGGHHGRWVEGPGLQPLWGGNARRRVAGAVRREVRRYLQMRMAMLVSTEVTESQVEMARTELSLLVDWPIFTLLGST